MDEQRFVAYYGGAGRCAHISVPGTYVHVCTLMCALILLLMAGPCVVLLLKAFIIEGRTFPVKPIFLDNILQVPSATHTATVTQNPTTSLHRRE